MGCCASTSAQSPAKSLQNEQHYDKDSRAPPPCNPLPEEEYVKEVLSETPSLPKKPAAILRARQEINYDMKSIKPLLPYVSRASEGKHQNDGILKKPISVSNPEEFSVEGASEICSTHSGRSYLSTSTYGTEMTDNDEGQRSFRQRDSRRADRAAGKPPAKRSSPGRVRSGSSGVPGYNGPKREPGESSARRSRSPANRTDGGGGVTRTDLVRSGSAKRNGKSPGRGKPDAGDKIRRVGAEPNNNTRENNWPPTSNDTIENPLVSLECFIFL